MKKTLFGLLALFVVVLMAGGALACVPTPTPTEIVPTFVPTFVPTPKPIPPVFGQVWKCSNGNNCFNYGVVPGPDAFCLLYDRSGVSTFSSISIL